MCKVVVMSRSQFSLPREGLKPNLVKKEESAKHMGLYCNVAISRIRFISRLLLLAVLATLFGIATVSSASAQSLTVRFVTLNVDFANSYAKVNADVQVVKDSADIIMFEEAKYVAIDDMLDSSWTVYQVTDQGDAKQGSALAIRNSIKTSVLATGLRLGVDNHGEDMLDRYIAWADVKLTSGLIVRVMALHMPPQRYQYLQPIMATNFEAFFDESPYPVVVGADWNYTVNNDPYNIQNATGLVPKGTGIDGFYIPTNVGDFVSKTSITGLNSDHNAVKVTLDMHVPTYVIDNTNAGFSASSGWATGTSAADKYGSNYRFHNTAAISDPASWTQSVIPGTYKIYAWWSQGSNRSSTAPYFLPDGTPVSKNQKTGGGQWNLLGTKDLSGSATTQLSCWTTLGYVVIADAIKYAP